MAKRDAKREAYLAHMAAQRAAASDGQPQGHDAARDAAIASQMQRSTRDRIASYLDAGATVERDSVEWRAMLLLRDGRSLSVFRHHLDEVIKERLA